MRNLIFTVSSPLSSVEYTRKALEIWSNSLLEYGEFSGDIVLLTTHEADLPESIRQIIIDNVVNKPYDIKKQKFLSHNYICFDKYDKVMCADLDILWINQVESIFDNVQDGALYTIEEYPDIFTGTKQNFVGGAKISQLVSEDEFQLAKGLPRLNNGVMVADSEYWKYVCERASEFMLDNEDINILSDQKAIIALVLKNIIQHKPLYRDKIVFPELFGYKYFTNRTVCQHYVMDNASFEQKVKIMESDYVLLQELGIEEYVNNRLSTE